MTAGVAGVRPPVVSARTRPWFAGSGLLLVVVVLVPPVSTLARHYLFVEALQFSTFALLVPALLVVGAPWRLLGLTVRPKAAPSAPGAPGPVDRLASGRRRHPQLARGIGFLAADVACIAAWRTPAAVDAVTGHHWLVLVETVSLVAAGGGLWLECVESPPVLPRLARPSRALLAALAMWSVWTVAYMQGMSRHAWYRGFAHRAGAGLSASADRQLSTLVLWVAALVFVPVVFWNLVQWLRSEEDPDEELTRLLREERRGAAPAAPSPAGSRAAPPA